MQQKVITLVGGTGFLGRYMVKLLADKGYIVRAISRNPSSAKHLKTAGDPGQVVLVSGNLGRAETLEGKLDNSYAVINLVGVLFESNHQNFSKLHAQGAEKLAKMAKEAGAERFIQISAIGVDKSVKSKYARTKATGEKAVKAAFPGATIVRPSIVFGPEDDFYNQFAQMAQFSPALPLIGGGNTKFQPVYVADVAKAIVKILEDDTSRGETYELGGPNVYSFREILEYILRVTGRKRSLVNLPFGIASLIGTFGELLPKPPLTRDQVRLLEYDNVVSKKAKGFAELDISPVAPEIIVPGYLARYAAGRPDLSHAPEHH